MAAAAISTPAQLVTRCAPMFTERTRFTRQTAAGWLKMDTAELSGELLYLVASCLRTRVTWLVTGEGGADREHVMRALAILDRLEPGGRERWLKAGERMTD